MPPHLFFLQGQQQLLPICMVHDASKSQETALGCFEKGDHTDFDLAFDKASIDLELVADPTSSLSSSDWEEKCD